MTLPDNDLKAIENSRSQLDSDKSVFSEFLNDSETIEAITTFPDEHRERIIGNLIQYKILFPEVKNISQFIDQNMEIIPLLDLPNGIFKYREAYAKIISQQIASYLGLESASTNPNQVVEYINERYFTNGYYFHSFNGVFEESILANGISTGDRLWDPNDLNAIKTIGRRLGIPMILGWHDINSENKTSITDETANICKYAYASPEWFAQFISEGFHIPNKEPYDKTAFYKRDYSKAKRNIDTLLDELDTKDPHITVEERNILLNNFEKYWKIFASENSKPKCALISRSAIGRNEPKYRSFNEYEEIEKSIGNTNYSIESCIENIIHVDEVDSQIKYVINPKDMLIINLPEYTLIHEPLVRQPN